MSSLVYDWNNSASYVPSTANLDNSFNAAGYNNTVSYDRTNFLGENTIRLEITNFTQLRQREKSSVIAGLPWCLKATTECSERTGNEKFLSVYMHCNPESESTIWFCEADIRFKLVNQHDPTSHFMQMSQNFHCKSNGFGFPSFMKWNNILDSRNGFIENNRVIIEAHVAVQNISGVRFSPMIDFTKPEPNRSDGVIMVEGKQLYVSKSYLATYSTYFDRLCFDQPRSRGRYINAAALWGEKLEEFIELLHVIYPSRKAITASNVEFLLKLGDKLEVSFVIEECERFLMRTDEIPVIKKLLWADQYELARLQDDTLKTFNTATDIKNLNKLKEYNDLSEATKAVLLEKIFKLL